MKVNFEQKFVGVDGKEMPGSPTIANQIASQLFAATTIKGQQMTAEKKYQSYRLQCKIAASPSEVEITTEEASLIKEIAAETMVAGAYGQIVDLIENN